MEAIKITNLQKKFGENRVLKGINLAVHQGEIFTLLGENGSGKSTLINILTTLAQATEGQATILGYNLRTQTEQVRQAISLNSQSVTIDDEVSGYENLKLLTVLLNLKNGAVRIKEVAQRLDLTGFLQRKVGTYSGGMKRRLDIAATLLSDSPILFLDEPTTGVDPKNRLEIWRIIQELRNEGKTIFLTTQYLDEAERLSDRIALLAQGKIVLLGTPQELKQQAESYNHISVPAKQHQAAIKTLVKAQLNFDVTDQDVVVESSNLQRALKVLIEKRVSILAVLSSSATLETIFLQSIKEDDK